MNTTTYAIYDLTTGALRWFMTSEPEHIDASTPAGCGWIEVDSTRDGLWHVDLDSKALVEGAIDTRSLAQVKLDQWAVVKAARDAAINSSFTWDGSAFDSDETSQRQIQGAVAAAALVGSSFSVQWTLKDNTTRTLSYDDVVSVGRALFAWVQTNFDRGVDLREQINAATSAEAVKAIGW